MNISVDGNSNNVAGRDLVFNQERPLRERLLEELTLKRNLKYANWKKYDDQRDSVKNSPAMSFKLRAVFMLCAVCLIFFLDAFTSAISSKPESSWVAFDALTQASPFHSVQASLTGLVIFVVLNLGFMSYISKSAKRREYTVRHLTATMSPLAKEINDLDTEIEALMNIKKRKP